MNQNASNVNSYSGYFNSAQNQMTSSNVSGDSNYTVPMSQNLGDSNYTIAKSQQSDNPYAQYFSQPNNRKNENKKDQYQSSDDNMSFEKKNLSSKRPKVKKYYINPDEEEEGPSLFNYNGPKNHNFDDILSNIKVILHRRDKPVEKSNIKITENDFNQLTVFEKRVLETIANIWGLGYNKDNLTLAQMQEILNKLGEARNNVEKNYLISLFFPEKVKNIHTIFPFPIPTHTHVQRYTYNVMSNKHGCFLAQLICPLFLDYSPVTVQNNTYVGGNYGTTKNPSIYNGNIVGDVATNSAEFLKGSVSNFYVNTSDNLDGNKLGTPYDFTPIINSRTMPGVFGSYILQCAKIHCKYHGRTDLQRGNLISGYHLSSYKGKVPDPSPTQYTFLEESINFTQVDTTENLSCVYFPADYSYLNFLRMNNDNIQGGQMSTNMRLNILGTALPGIDAQVGGTDVQLTVTMVWNVIPTPEYTEILPLDYDIAETDWDWITTASKVPRSGLSVYKDSDVDGITRFLNLPSKFQNNLIEDLASHKKNNHSKNKQSVLDIGGYLFKGSPPDFVLENNLWNKLIEQQKKKKQDNKNIGNLPRPYDNFKALTY
jgi:hypothetical protein